MSHLVLSRKVRQRLKLCLPDGGEVTITILRAAGDVVRLGVEAPRAVGVWREELLSLLPPNRRGRS
jgi:carbon storage regulator CsrA